MKTVNLVTNKYNEDELKLGVLGKPTENDHYNIH